MIKHLYLLRHGEPEGGDGRIRGQTNDPLTALGWQQMEQATQPLQFDAIFSSPLLRCAAFAQNLATTKQISCTLDERLKEMGMGAWEGKSKAEVVPGKDYQWQYARTPEAQLPDDAEAFTAISQRIHAFLADIQQHPASNLLIVAHAGVIRFMLADLLQMPVEAALRIKLPFAACLPITTHNNGIDVMANLAWPKGNLAY